MTLRQIINVYLHLCDNESIGEPESLYITLSTKLTASAAISELATAANEGKGLSEIFSWDEYDEHSLSNERHIDMEDSRSPWQRFCDLQNQEEGYEEGEAGEE